MNKHIPIHPFLFGVYPLLFLYSHNIYFLLFHDILVLIAIDLFVILVLLLLLSFILNDRKRAGLVASLCVLLFFSYGHIYNAIAAFSVGGDVIVIHRLLLLVYSTFFVAGVYIILRTQRYSNNFTFIFNIIAGVLVVIPLVNIGAYNLRRDTSFQDRKVQKVETRPTDAGSVSATLPNIYYIILDAYTSEANLKEYYNYDNHEFTGYLEDKGFYIASESRSNYAVTFLSLASSLNLKYLNELSEVIGVESEERFIPNQMIRNNTVMQFLRSKGYKLVHFKSGWGATDYNRYADLNVQCGVGNELLTMLTKTTVLRPLERYLNLVENDDRERVLCTFARLAQVQDMIEGPYFVFAHMLIPHPPYLFGPNAEGVANPELKMLGDIDLWKYKQLYIDQLIFLNKKVRELVDVLLTTADSSPVIVLQGDHGSASSGGWEEPGISLIKERTGILNAYYLPSNGNDLLYNSITPVNTFRLILDHYFGTSYGLLDDKIYFSGKQPYKFVDVTSVVSGN